MNKKAAAKVKDKPNPLYEAAPELLVACKALAIAVDRLCTECHQIPAYYELLGFASSAIEKAEGK